MASIERAYTSPLGDATTTVVRWVVRPGDGSRVSDVLARARVGAEAVGHGRVFVGRRRVKRGDEPVRTGDVVEIAPARDLGESPSILVQTSDLVAVDKPAGVPTIPDHSGAAHALVTRVAHVLGVDVSRVHPTSRLDRDVSGVVVLALTRAASERLRSARARGDYERRYVAIASRAPSPERGLWDAPIGRARDPRLRAVNGSDAVAARTIYAVCARAPLGAAMLAVAPITGRTHQIRVHAADAGAPLVGDRVYRGPTRLTLPDGRVLEPHRIALHAARVVVPDDRGAPLACVAPAPVGLRQLWSALGGEQGAWQFSVSCALP